jgi:hypothetical protein
MHTWGAWLPSQSACGACRTTLPAPQVCALLCSCNCLQGWCCARATARVAVPAKHDTGSAPADARTRVRAEADALPPKVAPLWRAPHTDQRSHEPGSPIPPSLPSSSSGGLATILLLVTQLKALQEERDQAKEQALALWASRGPQPASAAAEEVQVESREQRMRSLCNDLAVGATRLKQELKAMARREASLADTVDQLQHSCDAMAREKGAMQAAACGLEAAYASQKEENQQLEAGFSRLATDVARRRSACDVQKARFDQLAVDASELKAGYDRLSTANQQLTSSAAGDRAQYDRLQVEAAQLQSGYDVQHADFAKLKVDTLELQSGFDGLATANEELTDAALESRVVIDRLQVLRMPEAVVLLLSNKPTNSLMQVDADRLQLDCDGLASANQQLVEDAAGNKASLDKQRASYGRSQVSTHPW